LPTLTIAQFSTKWGNGYKVESADKAFKMKFGGRIMYDVALLSQDDEDQEFLGEFRRVRFFNSGTVYKNVKYKLQLDFAGKIAFKDVFIELTKIPGIGNVRVGHFKEPFRFNSLMSSKYMALMERANNIPFAPERNAGLMLHNTYNDHLFAWQVGVFGNGDVLGDDETGGDGSNIVARVSSKFNLVEDANDQYIHLAAAVNSRSKEEGPYSISARPAAHLAPKLATASIASVDQVLMMNFELAAVAGPAHFRGEFLNASVSPVEGDSYNFNSYYAQVGYFLTGESKPYKSSFGGFGRVSPNQNFGEGGPGAWELALRYQNLDLEDNEIEEQTLNGLTFGINWYLNPVTRMMINYTTGTSGADVTASALQMRFQIDF